MKRKSVFVLVLCLALIAVTAVIGLLTQESTININNKYNHETSKKVVCSFYPVYIAALNIAKGVEDIEITSLSQPKTGCLHDYQMTSEDVKLLESAGLFICNGGGMEKFVSRKEYAAKYPGLTVVYASENLPAEEIIEDNAHFWMDPDLYEIYVQKVAIALSDFDPDNAAVYMQNYADYAEKIENTIKARDTLNLGGKKAIILSDAIPYLAKDLGIEISMFIDMEEDAVSAEAVAEATEIIKNENAVILYDEEGEDIAKTLMSDTGALAVRIDVITSGDYSESAWLDRMTQNYDSLKEIK